MRSSDSRRPDPSTDTLPAAQREDKGTGDWAQVSTYEAPPLSTAGAETGTHPLAATDPASPWARGDRDGGYIQHYELVRELGRGGMGVVHLARDLRLGRLVAIKLLTRPGHLQERFLAEARATARCRHENIVVIHEVGVHGEQPYLVFEYLRGQTLRQWMDARLGGAFEVSDSSATFQGLPAPLPPARAVEMIVPVVRALICAHDMGIIHRDLKPANILLTEDGITKVLDFGVAKIGAVRDRDRAEDAVAPPAPLTLTDQGTRLGTLPYMSPEQLSGAAVDHRSDVWAVGIILFELVTGVHPLAPLSQAKILAMADLATPMPSVRDHRTDLGPLADIISRCLLKDREHRTATARELLAELEALLPARRVRSHDADGHPFVGLAAFQEADAERFFGRGHDVASVLGKLRSLPLVTVAGPAGAGKSSLVRAGVLPALKGSGEGWDAMVIRPGRQPLPALAEVLLALPGRSSEQSRGRAPGAAHAPSEQDTIVTRLRAEPGHLGLELRAWARSRLRRLVLFVDQLEELYALGADAADRACFAACLEAMADDAASPLRVILAVRSDFLDRMVEQGGLVAAVHRGLEFLSPLDRDGLREALTRPVAAYDHGFESADVVERILDQLEATRRPLPLLQLTARKLWGKRDRQQRLLGAAGLDAIGGVGGVLARHADAILAALPAQDARLARAVFLHLVTPDRARARATLSELRRLHADAPATERVLARLIDAGLLAVTTHAASAAGSADPDGVVEIVHEGLVHAWPVLGEWLAEASLDHDDGAEGLRIAAKLYGREQEREAMLAAVARVVAGGKELVLVTGYPGIGKSALVKELAAPVARARGYFVDGKFDQYHSAPYSALASAFGALIHQLLGEPEERLARWRHALRSALGANARVLVEVVPDLAQLIGPQPPVPRLDPTESEHRFTHALQCFLEVACQSEHPLVVLLDDLQWADAASLRLVKLMMTDPGLRHLLIVGTYRDGGRHSEPDSAMHRLPVTIAEIRQKATVQRIELLPLTVEHVCELLADTLERERADCAELAALVVARSAGNPFFVEQFLRALHQERLLAFDRELRRWRWDLAAIQALGVSDDVVELMVARMRKLPAPTQRVLELAACVGSSFDIGTLSIIGESSAAEVRARLAPAIAIGLVHALPVSDARPDARAHGGAALASHAFAHDRVQQAAYSLGTRDRAATHLRIARLLSAALDPAEREQRLFELAEHFGRGAALLHEPAERLAVARLCLAAGHRARDALSYDTARGFLGTGLALVAGDGWRTSYELTRDLALAAVEVEFRDGDIDAAGRLSDEILANARDLLDKVAVYEFQILFHITRNQPGPALEIMLSALAMLGVEVPPDPAARAARNQELRARLDLGAIDFEALERLPEITDPHQTAILRIMLRVIPTTYFVDRGLWELLSRMIVELCMRHGHTALAAVAYVTYSGLVAGVYHDYERGLRFGALAERLAERFSVPVVEVRTGNSQAVFLMPWSRPLREGAEALRSLVQRGFEVGELEVAMYCAAQYLFYQIILGVPLEGLQREALAHVALIERHAMSFSRDWACIAERMMRGLLGLPARADDPGPPLYSPSFLMRYEWNAQAMLRYILGDYPAALELSQHAEDQGAMNLSLLLVAEHAFCRSLAILAAPPEDPGRSSALLAEVERNQAMFERWSALVPTSFRHQHALVEAERARLRGDVETAMAAYDEAIEGARAQGRLRDEALGCERAAGFYGTLGRQRFARMYLGEACDAYRRWGARAKVARLESEHPWLAQSDGA